MSKTIINKFSETLQKKKLSVPKLFIATFITSLSLLGLIKLSTVFADTITWVGNGTSNGFCSTVTSDPSVSGQNWQFILTSPDGNGSYTLTTSFSPAGQTPASPYTVTSSGNGAVHFIINTAVGAKLLSASVTGGTSNSNLTVSDCTVGKASPTISTTPSAGGVIGVVLNDTAALSGGNAPTGNVTFNLFAPSDPT
ncbi:MAG TPA: hypothetical protein VLF90_02710, partial [Patescibacteria group bacterium]|nr:hypothetical protein [Patescibacteria group bacterium]